LAQYPEYVETKKYWKNPLFFKKKNHT
jgi:hypothetical protein